MPESCLRIEKTQGVKLVSFRDSSILDMLTIQRLGEELYRVVEDAEKCGVVLDFHDVRFLSSQALGVLLTLRRKADKAGVKVVLTRLRPELARVFQITNLDKIFEFFDSNEAAIAKLTPASGEASTSP